MDAARWSRFGCLVVMTGRCAKVDCCAVSNGGLFMSEFSSSSMNEI